MDGMINLRVSVDETASLVSSIIIGVASVGGVEILRLYRRSVSWAESQVGPREITSRDNDQPNLVGVTPSRRPFARTLM